MTKIGPCFIDYWLITVQLEPANQTTSLVQWFFCQGTDCCRAGPILEKTLEVNTAISTIHFCTTVSLFRLAENAIKYAFMHHTW